jgi:hypothetical protein
MLFLKVRESVRWSHSSSRLTHLFPQIDSGLFTLHAADETEESPLTSDMLRDTYGKAILIWPRLEEDLPLGAPGMSVETT